MRRRQTHVIDCMFFFTKTQHKTSLCPELARLCSAALQGRASWWCQLLLLSVHRPLPITVWTCKSLIQAAHRHIIVSKGSNPCVIDIIRTLPRALVVRSQPFRLQAPHRCRVQSQFALGCRSTALLAPASRSTPTVSTVLFRRPLLTKRSIQAQCSAKRSSSVRLLVLLSAGSPPSAPLAARRLVPSHSLSSQRAWPVGVQRWDSLAAQPCW